MPNAQGKYRVLSLDGGGVRGLLTAEVLRYVEAQLGKPLHQCFDLVAGSSTGALISMALTRPDAMTAQQLADFYLTQAPRIFAHSTWQRISSMATLNGPKYNNTGLYQATLGALGGNTVLGQAQCNVMATCYDLQQRSPRFMTSWGTPDLTMVSAAMRSSAAPTYYPPFEGMVDGGTVDNSPALTAVIEACRLYSCTVRDVVCLSIGTGSDQQPIDPEAAQGWGLLSWAQPLLSIFMDGSSTLATYQLQRLLPDANVLRLQCDVQGTLSEMDNTTTTNMAALQAAGRALVQARKPALDAFLAQLS